jgi:hypothetical protein
MKVALALASAIAAADPVAIHAAGAADSTAVGAGTRELFIQVCYLAASVLFIFGLRGLTAPDKARRGMQLAAIGMLSARPSARPSRSGCR